MKDTPRRRAQLNGLCVNFESRNPHLASVRWHPRFKLRYRTKADALTAKQVWEERGKILWPGDLRPEKKPESKPMRRRESVSQVEMRI
jgi:hypothetical protein